MSQKQFDKFKEYVIKLNSNYSNGNNRKTFDLNGRKVYKSEINDDDSYESDSDSNVFIKFSISLFYLILILF